MTKQNFIQMYGYIVYRLSGYIYLINLQNAIKYLTKKIPLENPTSGSSGIFILLFI